MQQTCLEASTWGPELDYEGLDQDIKKAEYWFLKSAKEILLDALSQGTVSLII